MYCTKCGKQIEDGVKFCQYCGGRIASYGEEAGRREEDGRESTVPSDVGMRDTVVSDVTGQDTIPSENGLGGFGRIAGGPSGGRFWSGAERGGTQDVQRMGANGLPEPEERPWLLFVLEGIAVAAVVAIAIVSYLLLSGRGVKAQAAEQLKLGNRYLEEMDYEQAVVAFTKTIEIDPSNVDAYLGASMAYAALENYQEALNILESGYETTEAPQIAERGQEVCLEAAEYYMDEEDYGEAKKYIEKGKEYGTSEKLEEASGKLEETSEKLEETSQEEDMLPLEREWHLFSELESGDRIYYLSDSSPAYGKTVSANQLCQQAVESSCGYAVVQRGDFYGLIDMDGNFLDGFRFIDVEMVTSVYSVTYAEPHMDSDGMESTELMVYDGNSLSAMKPGDYIGNGFYFWNQGLKQVTDGIYGEMPEPGVPIPVSEGQGEDTHMDMDPDGFLMKQYRSVQGKYAIYSDGGLTTDFIYDECGSYSEGLFAACQNGKWGYVNKNGEVVIPFEYDASWEEYIPFESYHYEEGEGYKGVKKDFCYAASDGYVVLRQGDAWEIRDVQGRLAVPQGEFETLLPVYGNRCWAKKDGQWGILELKLTEENGQDSQTQGIDSVENDLLRRVNYYSADGELLYYENYVYYGNGVLCSRSFYEMWSGWGDVGPQGIHRYTEVFLYDSQGNQKDEILYCDQPVFSGADLDSLVVTFGAGIWAEKAGDQEYRPGHESIEQEKFGVDPGKTEQVLGNAPIIPMDPNGEWAKAYLNEEYLIKTEYEEWATCEFMYINNDDIPELCYMNGIIGVFLTAKDGTADHAEALGSAARYVKRGNLAGVWGGGSDWAQSSYYQVENGRVLDVGNAYFHADRDNDTLHYSWNDEEMPEAEVRRREQELLNNVEWEDDSREVYSVRQCREILAYVSGN